MEGTPPIRPWLHALVQRILNGGAIPAGFKLLMAMVTDAFPG